MKLFEMNDAIEHVLASEVDRETGEITDETLAKLDELEVERDEKALAIARYIVGERAEAEAVKAQAERLSKRAKAHKARAARLLDYLDTNLPERHNLRDEVVQIAWRSSTSVDVPDPAKLPDEFVRVTFAADKTAIKTAIQGGDIVPGAQLTKHTKLGVR